SINDVTSNLYAYARDHGHFLRTLNKTGILIGFEAQYLCKDGRVIWMSVNARQIKDATGEIEYYEGSFLDITQRKQAQQDLQESLGRYRLLLEASPIPIAVYDPEGRVSYVNPAFVDTFGWSMAELMGRRPDFVPSHEAAKTGQAIKRTLKGERVSIQSQRLTREQKVLDVLINAALYTDHSGKPQGIIVTFRDFTELKQAERDLSKHRDHLEQLVEERTQELTQANQRLSEEIIEHKATETALMDSKERFRQLAEMLPETVFEMDLFSNFTFRNKASFTTFGYESHIEEAPGNALDSIVPEDHQRVIENCAKILEGEPSMGNEYRAIRRDGSIFPIMIYTNALMEDGQAIGYRGILLDISERKEMEEALRLAKESADHANKTKSEFLASMSHEIRTPMNAILGMGDLLLESNLTPEQKRYVQILTQSGENLLDIINDILDLSKVEAGQLALESMGFNLQELIDQSCEMMAVKAHSKGLELLSRTKAQTPIHLSGDPARLRQILINLMGNAIKFTHAGEVVLEIVGKDPLSWENKNRVCLEFSVRDTGIGISKEKQSHIFESFTQADSSTTREFGGTGLGLTICKRLVEMMGGEIWVESDPGHGCVFYFTAWFNMDTQPRTHRATPAAEIRGKQVLVVDDNATNRFILNETLSGWGANVSEAENGALALEAIEASEQANTPFDLILLDGKMPVLDGFETAKQINQRFNHMVHTVMLLTSDDSCSKIARAKKNGVPVCLIKPVKRRELKEAICAAMGQAISTGKNDHTPGKGELPSTERALNILIVEDGQENRILLRAYLKKSPHILDMAENGQLGVEKFMSASYDLVFMDMRMPVMDGYTATRTIRRWEEEQGRPRTFIVALTAHAMKEDRQKCLDAGCSDYLSKPVKKKDLLKMIEKG
ncbi:MAG: PAS domain S-box protein, partial [Desulfobacula sp.]|nr:PAS domain S-box protein [Desulfobacula sp.]